LITSVVVERIATESGERIEHVDEHGRARQGGVGSAFRAGAAMGALDQARHVRDHERRALVDAHDTEQCGTRVVKG
jgi:hypothetical protein